MKGLFQYEIIYVLQCHEDFEFKKLLIAAMVAMSKDPTAVQVCF